ncbi:MAG TPA: hypothetical protein VKQ32_18945 [Polyangia bacterium]|nr:hypothetical protein [Polyangia bacterium]
MEHFPEQHELISFFECEPAVLDAGVPWAHNHLEFRTRRGADEFLATIEPGYETFRFQWRRNQRELIRFALERVCRLDLQMSAAREVLIVGFRPSVGVSEMRIQLKPEPHIEWAVSADGV